MLAGDCNMRLSFGRVYGLLALDSVSINHAI